MNNDNSNINNYNQQAQQIWQEAMQKIEALSQQQLQNINTNPPRIQGALTEAMAYNIPDQKKSMIRDGRIFEFAEYNANIKHKQSSDGLVIADEDITLQKR